VISRSGVVKFHELLYTVYCTFTYLIKIINHTINTIRIVEVKALVKGISSFKTVVNRRH